MGGINDSSSTQTSSSRPMIQGDLKNLRSNLSNYFNNMLGQGQGALSNPGGIIGSQWNNLFGSNPTGDFLGARAALQGVMSGDTVKNSANQAYQNFLPLAQRNMQLMNNNVLNANSGLGNRLSSDVMNQQRQGSSDILNNLLAQSVGAGLQTAGLQGQTAQGLYGLMGQLGTSQMAQQLPLLAQYASAFAPTGGTSQGSSSAFGFWI